MKHVGILAHSAEGASLCFRAFCQEGFNELGPNDHPDVTLDCIPLARSMPSARALVAAESKYTSQLGSPSASSRSVLQRSSPWRSASARSLASVRPTSTGSGQIV